MSDLFVSTAAPGSLRSAGLPVPDDRPGTVGAVSSFLITDIEGSTHLWEQHGAAMGEALALHDHRLRAAVHGYHGTIIMTTGDGLLAVFDDPIAAVQASVALATRPA